MLVLGGIASGKSLWAETSISKLNYQKVYFATSEQIDEEIQKKITLHKQRRGEEWELIEAPLTDGSELLKYGLNHVILFECLSTWLGNLIHHSKDIDQLIELFIKNLNTTKANVCIVSVEVGFGVIPADPISRKFVQLIGNLHQQIAKNSDQVVLVSAGIPIFLKETN